MKILLSIFCVLTFVFFSSCATAGNNSGSNKVNNTTVNSSPSPNVEPSIDRTPPANANKAATKTEETSDMLTTDGQLRVGKSDSYILYLGKESGDLAAYCFANDSEAGRAILAACKHGEQCEFTGEVDNSNCEIVDDETERILSASGRIVKLKSARKLASAKK